MSYYRRPGGAAEARERSDAEDSSGDLDLPAAARYLGIGAAGAVAALAYGRLRSALRGDSHDPLARGLDLTGAHQLPLGSPLLNLRASGGPNAGHVTVNIDQEILEGGDRSDGVDPAIGEVVDRLSSAASEGQWTLAEAAAERTVELALQAIMGGDQPALRQLGNEVRKLRFKLFLTHRMSEASTPERVVGMLAGMSALIALAELAPPPADARNAAEAILQALFRKHQLTTTELARESGYRQETVARTLVHLRKAGLVLSAKAGRNMQNSLTPAGRRRAFGLTRSDEAGDDPRPMEPISLRRESGSEIPDCGPRVKPAELIA